jgi:hypothetical protein
MRLEFLLVPTPCMNGALLIGNVESFTLDWISNIGRRHRDFRMMLLAARRWPVRSDLDS